jgi:hypothetical protein
MNGAFACYVMYCLLFSLFDTRLQQSELGSKFKRTNLLESKQYLAR